NSPGWTRVAMPFAPRLVRLVEIERGRVVEQHAEGEERLPRPPQAAKPCSCTRGGWCGRTAPRSAAHPRARPRPGCLGRRAVPPGCADQLQEQHLRGPEHPEHVRWGHE